MDARKVILTVEVDTILPYAELKQLHGMVFGKLKGRGRRTIKSSKPPGTQHDCFGLIRQVQVNIQGPSKNVELDKPRGHPRRDDWGKKPKRGASKKRRATKAAPKRAPRKPRPSELRARAARAAAKAARSTNEPQAQPQPSVASG